MKNKSIILAAGVAVAMASTAALGARVDSTYSDTGIKALTPPSNVTPGSARVGTVYSFDVAGIDSVDGLGAAGNTVIAFDLATALGFPAGTQLIMNGIGWDVTLTGGGPTNAQPGSWLSEMAVYFDDNIAPDGVGLHLRPGVADAFAGTASYFNAGDKLLNLGIPDIPLPDGVLRMEFYESFNDGAGRDGLWKQGSLFIQVVPTPGAAMLLGLGGLAMIRRRR